MAGRHSDHPHHAHPPSPADVEKVAQLIADCDQLLVVGAAGLSISADLPNNPYHSEADFQHHYPTTAKYGYRTAFQAMRLAGDESVPLAVRRAHTARHFLNMRFEFPPTPAYHWLKELAASFGKDDVFAWTSNVDGCFARAGFDPAHVYTTQGEMNRYQCAERGCGNVWLCEAQLRQIDAASHDGVLTDLSLAMQCPKCGSTTTLPNLRGGDWFDHAPYLPTQQALLVWLDNAVTRGLSVAVLEVGVGTSTPIVTQIPAASFATAVGASGGRAVYVRVNLDRPEPPSCNPAGDNVSFFRWQAGWQVLGPLVDRAVALRTSKYTREGTREGTGEHDEHGVGTSGGGSGARSRRDGPPGGVDRGAAAERQQRYTQILHSLRTPRE